MKLNLSSMGARIAFASTAVLAGCLALMFWAMSQSDPDHGSESRERELRSVAAALVSSTDSPLHRTLREGAAKDPLQELQRLVEEGFGVSLAQIVIGESGARELRYVYLADPGGKALVGRQFRPNAYQARALTGEILLVDEGEYTGEARVAFAPVRGPDGQSIGIVELSAIPMLRSSGWFRLASTLMILTIGGWLLLLLTGKIITPLSDLVAASAQTDTQPLDEEAWAARGYEVGQISQALNRVRNDSIELGFNPREVLESESSLYMLCDKKGLIEYASPSVDVFLCMPNPDIVGIKLNYFVATDHEEELGSIWDKLHQGEPWSGNLKLTSPNLAGCWARLNICPQFDAEGEVTRFVISITNISELIATQHRLENLALYDQVTGLPNRQLLYDRLDQALAELNRRDDMLAVFYIDLDRFKRINDTFGHTLGDQAIQEISLRLKENLRREDTVASLGGDEFVLISMGLKNENGASAIVRKLTESLSRPIHISNYEILITASIGITIAPTDGSSRKDLLKNAGLAMYEAKKSGRNNFQFFTEELNYAAVQRMYLETEIRRSLEQEHFVTHYQPQIDLSDGGVTSLEALIRWEHPERGLISPIEFVPIAEDSGQIINLGAWVLQNSCHEIQRIRSEHGFDLQVAVNLSPRQFLDPHLLETVQKALESSGLPPNRLELELTESSLLDNLTEVIRVLKALKNLGVSVAIDDFGTGYSSLSYLKKFPIDLLKVDRSFVRDIPDDPNDCEIATAIVAIGKSLNLKVVAEGIETDEQAAFLSEAGCDFAQGYLFARPMPAGELVEFLGNSKTYPLKV